MKRIRFILPTVVAITLTGCSGSQEVAYWTDSSYKSTLDYDAEQKKELENEIGSVQTAIQDILNNSMNPITPGSNNNNNNNNNNNGTPNVPGTNDHILDNADRAACIAYFRQFLIDNKSNYGRFYLNVDKDCDKSVVPVGAGSPTFVHNNGQTDINYINIVAVATLTSIDDEMFYNYLKKPLDGIFTQTMLSSPDGVTMTYGQFKDAMDNVVIYYNIITELGNPYA